jgi:AraC family transcriptional regulator of adaptative response / DNA-3-methyladenine glycosylase II
VALGEPLDPALAVGNELSHAFPTVERLAAAPDELFAMPTARRDTVRRLAAAVAEGSVELDAGSDPHVARDQLLALKGIGPWTTDYVMMRGLGHPDVFLGTDLVAVNALAALNLTADDTAAWSPWRSYALHHLWASLGTLQAAAADAVQPRKDTA